MIRDDPSLEIYILPVSKPTERYNPELWSGGLGRYFQPASAAPRANTPVWYRRGAPPLLHSQTHIIDETASPSCAVRISARSRSSCSGRCSGRVLGLLLGKFSWNQARPRALTSVTAALHKRRRET